jgi:O-acetyl-ADP-ribose deacetylase (regulator of RNase III)
LYVPGVKGIILVLIAGDRDFNMMLERAQSMGIRTVLIHANNVGATRAIEAYTDFVFAGAWPKLLRMFSIPGSPEADGEEKAAQLAKVGKVGKGKPGKPTAASGGGGGAGGGAAATDAQPDLIQVETTAPVSMFAQIHRGLVASKLAAEVRLGNDEEDDDSDPANRLTIATSRVDKKAFVTVATPPTTSPTIRSKLAGALKAYLIGLDRSKRVVPLSGVTSDSLLNGNVKTELFQYAREKEAFFFIPRGAGNTTDEQGAATVIVIGHTPTAVAEAHQFLLKYERSSKTVPLSGSYVSGFVQRKMPEYKEEAERRFDVELEMVGEGKERSLVLTGRSPSVAKAEKWLTTMLKQIRYEKLPVGDCALRPEDMVSAIKVARRAALAEIRSQDMVEGAEESGATDDDASTDSAPASATPSRFLISIFRPQQGQFIVCVGHRDHLQIAVDKVKEMVLSVVRDTAAGLSPEAVRAHGLETPAGRETFQQQFNLHSVSYDMAKRRVTLMGPASEVQSAIEQLKQTENATDYCYLTDASLAGFYRSKPFQDELRRAIGTEKDVKVSTTHKDSSNVKKVVCLRGPKGAVDQLQPRVQATLDTLLRRVTDGLWHVSPAKFAFLKDEKEAVSGIARANKVLVSFLDKPDAECVESPPVPRPRTSVPTQPKHYPLREGCVLEVLNMDMSRLYVACLVNPANDQLSHGGGLARVISMAGGPIVERESRDIVSRHGGRLKTGQVVHTSPGNLSQSGVRRLLHVVVPKTSEKGHVKLLGTAVAECLRQCDETPRAEPAAQGGGSSAVSRLASMFGGAIGSKPAPSAPVSSDAVDSIAFTLMGSGIYGWDEGTSARTILRAIKDYFSGARSGGRLKRVAIFDQDQHKWETAIREADKTFGNGVLGLARRMVATPAATPGPAPPTARPLLPPKPQPPVKPSHVFYWNNAAGNAREDTGNCVWVPYDYDQCMAILNAEAAGQKNVHVTGDRIGQLSDTRHKDPETGRGEYVVHFNYQGTTAMVQTNRVSKFERLVMSKPVVTDADLPPLYDKALQRYHDALLAWGQQQRQQQQQQQAQGGGGGGGAAVVQGLRPASAPRPTKAVQLTGFATNVEGVKRALQQLLADNTREMEGEGILLPAFLSLDTVKEGIAALLDQYEAEIVVAGSGLHGSSMLRVRALGEIARVRVAHHLQAAISREEKDVVPKGWVLREATPGKELNLVKLAETDSEYQAAKARFLAHGFTCGGVTKIERVENPELYREYVTKRRLITAQLKEAGIADGGRTELVVHGTRTTSPAAVCGDINGLSPNYCERGMYGRAVYLAENTAYSDVGYAHDLGNGLHQLMLVEMVVGRIDERTAGDQNIKKPKDWHHTIAGPVGGNYRAYMKYEPYHTYPTHIITYRKK